MLSIFPQLFAFQEFAPFIIRLALALVFISRGYPKLFKKSAENEQSFGSFGANLVRFWNLVSGIVEFFGGILLFAGFLTQGASLLLSINMLVTIFLMARKKGFSSDYGFDLILLVMLLSLLVLGSGAFSIDLPF